MLVKCPECDLQVSDKALSCPHCGYPLTKNETPKLRKKYNKRRRLPNGFGQISEIKNRNLKNPFRAMITVDKSPTGKPICQLLKPRAYFETYNDAYEALLIYNRDPSTYTTAVSMKTIYELFIEQYRKECKEKSVDKLERAWKYCSYAYDIPVRNIRPPHIKKCIDEGYIIKDEKIIYASPSIKISIKEIFNLSLDYAVEYAYIDRNYSRQFIYELDAEDESKIKHIDHIPFTEEEMKLLWDNVDKIEGIDLVLIQCYSGWRPQELGLIETKNVDIINGYFMGGIKTDSGINRLVPIHSKILPFVKKRYYESLQSNNEKIFTFPSNRHKKDAELLTYSRYAYIFKNITQKLNFSVEHRAHDGRKHFITTAKKYNVDEYAIKYIVGHKINDLTERVYTERSKEWLKSEIEKIK